MTCWGWWPSFICSKPVLKFYGEGYWDGLWVAGGWMGQKWRPRNTHVNCSRDSWTRAKTPQMPSWASPYGASGSGSHGDVTYFSDIFPFNCWSSPFSFSQQELQWETLWDTQLSCYSSINPPRQGQWEIKIHCHFTQLLAPVWSGRNKRSGSMFPIRSTSASVHPDTQSLVKRMEWTWTKRNPTLSVKLNSPSP